MTGPDPRAAIDRADGYLPEDEALLAARAAAVGLGRPPVSPATGAALAFLAATISARAVVEIGTGTGVSGLWTLRGMAADGVLTSIDVDPEGQRTARRTFLDAGFGPSRLRLINGLGLEVLPRLTDGGYDLVVVDTARGAGGAAAEYPRYLEEAVRLLRPGGVVALAGVLRADGPGADALREAREHARDCPHLVPALLPLGDGLLAAVRLP